MTARCSGLARPNGARSISGVKCEIVEGDLNDPDRSIQWRTAALRYIMWLRIIVSGRPTLPNSIGRTTRHGGLVPCYAEAGVAHDLYQ